MITLCSQLFSQSTKLLCSSLWPFMWTIYLYIRCCLCICLFYFLEILKRKIQYGFGINSMQWVNDSPWLTLTLSVWVIIVKAIVRDILTTTSNKETFLLDVQGIARKSWNFFLVIIWIVNDKHAIIFKTYWCVTCSERVNR